MVDWAQLQLAGETGSIFVAVLIIFLYLMFRMRRRRQRLSDEPIMTREVREDRAYNQIHIARAAADRLERSGVDVRAVRRLLEQAEAARARCDSETAMSVARSAQEALARLRDQPVTQVPLSAAAVSPIAGGFDPATQGGAPFLPSPSEDGAANPFGAGMAVTEAAPTVGRLPKNKAEAHFQLTLLQDEWDAEGRKGSASADLSESRKIGADAQSAYDRSDYTEALRLGLKARRRVGARLETLPPTAATHPETEPDAPSSRGSEAEAPGHCSNCGQPLRPSNRFCRGCGSSKGATRCGACGQPLAGDDRFCGACGEPIRA